MTLPELRGLAALATLVAVMLAAGCGRLPPREPGTADITAGETGIPSVGVYCFADPCAEEAPARLRALANDLQAPVVKPGTEVAVTFPTAVVNPRVFQWVDDDLQPVPQHAPGVFLAPEEPGEFLYLVSGRSANGTALRAFRLQVEEPDT